MLAILSSGRARRSWGWGRMGPFAKEDDSTVLTRLARPRMERDNTMRDMIQQKYDKSQG